MKNLITAISMLLLASQARNIRELVIDDSPYRVEKPTIDHDQDLSEETFIGHLLNQGLR